MRGLEAQTMLQKVEISYGMGPCLTHLERWSIPVMRAMPVLVTLEYGTYGGTDQPNPTVRGKQALPVDAEVMDTQTHQSGDLSSIAYSGTTHCVYVLMEVCMCVCVCVLRNHQTRGGSCGERAKVVLSMYVCMYLGTYVGGCVVCVCGWV